MKYYFEYFIGKYSHESQFQQESLLLIAQKRWDYDTQDLILAHLMLLNESVRYVLRTILKLVSSEIKPYKR
jgi:hypothetical protein